MSTTPTTNNQGQLQMKSSNLRRQSTPKSRGRSKTKSRRTRSRSQSTSSRSRRSTSSRSRSTSRSRRSTNRSRSTSSRSRRSTNRSRTSSRSRSSSRSRTKRRSRSISRSRTESRKQSRTRERQKSARKPRARPGYELNPVTLKSWSTSRQFREIQQKVADLPASQPQVKEDLFNLLDETNIILLSGDTGSGKTTQVPKLVWEYLNYADTVICTQPRTLTAQGVAKRVAEEMDVELGRHVGFRFKGSEKDLGGAISGYPILVYMTEGTFLNNTMKDVTSLYHYGAVIIDEAHDRTIDTDLLMFFIRETLGLSRLQTKFIIMSATLDKEIFLDYFRDYNIKHYHIPGRTFPVTTKSLVNSIFEGLSKPRKISGVVEKTCQTILNDIFQKRDLKALSAGQYNDILIFIPSKAWIYKLQETLTDFLTDKGFTNFVVMDLSADVPIGPERDIRLKAKPGFTKIILSTNIAETGVSVEGITYVIDTGLAYNVEFDMETREEVMDLGFISQAEAKQRQGRAGRMQPGTCYRLFTNQEFATFKSHKKPEIYRSRFDSYLLRFFYQFKNREDSFQLVKRVIDSLISPPTKLGLTTTLKFFRNLGLLEDKHQPSRISPLGECYQALSGYRFELISFLLTSLAYEIEPEIVFDLTAILEVKSDLGGWIQAGRDGLPEEYHQPYINKYGDLVGLYHIYLDLKTDKLPEEFKKMLNLNNFNKLTETSEAIQQSAIQFSLCDQLVKTKYPKRNDPYQNLVSAFRQTFGHQVISAQDLDISRYSNSMIDLKQEQQQGNDIIYLSTIVRKIFGQNPSPAYDNFVKIS